MASAEQRNTFRLLSYWKSIKGEQTYPQVGDISLSEMEELWNYCFILDVSDKKNPEFQHFGSELATIFGQDHTGDKLSDPDLKFHGVLSDIPAFFDEVWLMEAPASHCGYLPQGEGNLRYRSIIAPLAQDGEQEISLLIGTTNYRLYD